jgi:zinc transporter ZupT
LFTWAPSGDKKIVNNANALAAFIGAGVGLFIMYSIKAFGGEDDDDVASLASGQSNKIAPQGQLTASALGEPLHPNRGGDLDDDDSTPPTPRSCAEEGRWFEPEALEVSDDLTDKCKRLAKQTEDLSKVVQADTVNRDALDEHIHQLDFTVDSARRACRGADHMDLKDIAKMRVLTQQLVTGIHQLEELGEEPTKGDVDSKLRVVRRTLRHLHSHAHRGPFRRWAPKPVLDSEAKSLISAASLASATSAESSHGKVPWSFVVTVVVDAVVDGMLIGLAAAVSRGSGGLMACATAIEMGFLGYSFTCALIDEVSRVVVVALAAVPPLTMLAASLLADWSSDSVKGTPAFVGLVAFALVALLFLVMQELLLEAQEKEDGDSWSVSIWLYLGLALSIFVDTVL